MRCSSLFTLFASLAAAAPNVLQLSQAANTTTVNDLLDGHSAYCPTAILIFARGSTEAGNMGTYVGPYLVQGLSAQVQNLWVQGIGGNYTAELEDNFLPKGTSPEAIAEAYRMFSMAHEKCPKSAVLAGGYSQGAALVAAAVPTLNDQVREQIKGAVLFGYTQNKQNCGRIPHYPVDRTKVFCNEGDVVCEGILEIKLPHLQYSSAAQGEAANFLASKITK